MAAHTAYTDESNWNTGTYRSICMISGETVAIKEAEKNIKKAMKASGAAEFKWQDFKGEKQRLAAEKIIGTILPYCVRGLLRVDLLIWDINDNRHRINHRDDAKNFGRMYYHLFYSVLKNRWPDNAVWQLRPDEHDQIDWGQLQEILDYKSAQSVENSLFDKNLPKGSVSKERLYEIEDIHKCDSRGSVIIQAADLFAGMACYSKLEYSKFADWLDEDDSQMTMFDLNFRDFSETHRARFSLMKEFHEACVSGGLGLGLRSYGCFYTADPKNPVNFWWYTPQPIHDKTPTRFKLNDLKNKEL